jgi:hypothetical protein
MLLELILLLPIYFLTEADPSDPIEASDSIL